MRNIHFLLTGSAIRAKSREASGSLQICSICLHEDAMHKVCRLMEEPCPQDMIGIHPTSRFKISFF
jgi:hypothetical protein